MTRCPTTWATRRPRRRQRALRSSPSSKSYQLAPHHSHIVIARCDSAGRKRGGDHTMQFDDKFAYIRALRGANLTHPEHRVLIAVWSYTDNNGQRAYASVARLAVDCRMAESTVRRCLIGLREKRFLHRCRRGGRDAEPRASEYELCLPDKKPTAQRRAVGESSQVLRSEQLGWDPTAQDRRPKSSGSTTQPLTAERLSDPEQIHIREGSSPQPDSPRAVPSTAPPTQN